MVLRARYGLSTALVRPTWYPRGRERWFPWEKSARPEDTPERQVKRRLRRAKRPAEHS